MPRVRSASARSDKQLYGYAISAKRYALYQRTGNELSIIDPKAHGLGYLFPPTAGTEEQGWTYEAWDGLLREALGLPRNHPSWLDLPAMMRIVLSTPHALQRLDRSTRPYNFLLCPLIDTVAGYPATRGLLQRACVAAGKFRYVGKETDRRWEQGADLSLTSFSPVEYSQSGKMIVADAALLEEMAERPMREMMRKTGLSQHTLEAIRNRKAVRSRTLAVLKQSFRPA